MGCISTEDLDKLVSNYFSGFEIPKFHQFLMKIQETGEIWSVADTLMDNNHDLPTQFFGLIVLESAITSASSGAPLDDRRLQEKLLSKIFFLSRDDSHSTCDLLNPVLKKTFEVLVHSLFRAGDSQSSAIRWIISSLSAGGDDGGCSFERTIPISHQYSKNVLTFLLILLEEFSSITLPLRTRSRIKHSILSDESTVLETLKKLVNICCSDDIIAMAMNCCSLWISTMLGESRATECIGFTDLLYTAMHRSERLFAVGLDCLITLLENGGLGLCSGRDTAYLLDYHVHNIARFENVVNNLVQYHSSALNHSRTWLDFEHRELLVKMALVLLNLAESQMEHLLSRISRDKCSGKADSLILFKMFLFPLLIQGHFPHDQAVSDLGLQIWFTFLDTLFNCQLNNERKHSLDRHFFDQLQCEFLEAAFPKCRYPSKLDEFCYTWTLEERDQWYKFRGELGDTFLLAYTGHRTCVWFERMLERIDTLLTHLFHVDFSVNGSENSLVESASQFPTNQSFIGAMISFVLTCIDIFGRVDLCEKLWPYFISSVCKTLLKILGNTDYISLHVDDIIRKFTLMDVRWLLGRASLEHRILQVAGMLLPYTLDHSFFTHLVQSLCGWEEDFMKYSPQCGSFGVGVLTENVLDHTVQEWQYLLKQLTHYVSGIQQTLKKLDGQTKEPGYTCWLARGHTIGVLLRLIYDMNVSLQRRPSNPNVLDQFFQLWLTSLTICLPVQLGNSPEGYRERIKLLSDITLQMINYFLVDSANLQESFLQTIWFLIQTPYNFKGAAVLGIYGRLYDNTTALNLLTSVFERVDAILTRTADRALRTLGAEPMAADGSMLQHPISPYLMAISAQSVTDQIDVTAKFFKWVLKFPIPPDRVHTPNSCGQNFLCILDQRPQTNSGRVWRLAFSVCFAGMCVPEWSTAECCISLARNLLEHLCSEYHTPLLSTVVTPHFLFHLHASLIVIIARDALPRRLMSKYAELYQILSRIVPDKQFELLRFMLGLTCEPLEWMSEVRASSAYRTVLESVGRAVSKTSVAQREHFMRTILRAFTSSSILLKTLTEFALLCGVER